MPDWSEGKDRYPLPLCEFLIYKAILSYADELPPADRERFAVARNYQFFNSAPNGDTQGYGFVIGDTGFIVLRGSTSRRDWIDSLTAAPTDGAWVGKSTLDAIGGAEPKRHLGIARAWACVFPKIGAWIDTLPPDVTRLCLSGHSLGGGLAIMGAYELERRRPGSVAAVVVFGAPHVGGERFREIYENELGLKNRTLRVESPEDVVTRASPYRPVGNLWSVDKRPMIAGMEKVWAALLGIAGWMKTEPGRDTGSSPTQKPEAGQGPGADTGDGASAGDSETSRQQPKQQKPKQEQPADDRGGLVMLIVVAVGVLVFLAARKLVISDRAHKAAKRYALYFSTLSYQKIRAFRLEPATSSEVHYENASHDLDRHLEFIRGPISPVYDEIKDRPVRALTKEDADRLDEATRKGYAGYIW